MDKISLYRKYRPHNFDNLVGQDHVKNILVNALKSGHVSHVYLFTGPRGTGKTSTARLLAKALNCVNLGENYEPCDECDFCKDISEGHLIDLIEIDAASNRGIDEVRDLKEKISFAPTRAKYKIYIIDEVHMMTKDAFNALLKTLEEPPSHTYFILATTEVHKIPETIISRCQRFDFRRISKKALMTRLSFIAQMEEIKAEDTALELISRYVDGGLRDAIGLMEQLTENNELTLKHAQEILGISSFSLLENFFEALMQKDTKTALQTVNELHTQGSDLNKFLHELIDLIREKMLEHVAKDENNEAARLIQMIEVFQETQGKLEDIIPQLPLELAVIRLTGDMPQVIIDEKGPREEKEKTTIQEDNKTEEMANPEEESPEMSGPLTLDYLKKSWPRIAERIKTPSLRMSLRHATPSLVDNFNITLAFGTKFHRDKVMEHENRIELEGLIKELFDKPVKIAAQLKELEMKPVIEENHEDDKQEDSVLDEAMEIFGGEIMEE